jgi:TolB-like protein
MSGSPEQQYLSESITEDIITELARFRQIHVLSRNSSFQYAGKAAAVWLDGLRRAACLNDFLLGPGPDS